MDVTLPIKPINDIWVYYTEDSNPLGYHPLAACRLPIFMRMHTRKANENATKIQIVRPSVPCFLTLKSTTFESLDGKKVGGGGMK